jgi:hypothetical protein
VAFDASAVAFCQFMLHQGAKTPRGGPAVFIGLPGKVRPERFYGGHASLVQRQGEPGGVDIGLRQAASCCGPRAGSRIMVEADSRLL